MVAVVAALYPEPLNRNTLNPLIPKSSKDPEPMCTVHIGSDPKGPRPGVAPGGFSRLRAALSEVQGPSVYGIFLEGLTETRIALPLISGAHGLVLPGLIGEASEADSPMFEMSGKPPQNLCRSSSPCWTQAPSLFNFK